MGTPAANAEVEVLPPSRAFAAALVLAAAAMAFLTYENGRTQFGGFDYSLLVELAFRQSIGQEPYRDFVMTMPPFLALEARYAFEWFGPYWTSLVAVSTAQAAVVVLFSGWYASRAGLPPLLSLALAAMLGASQCAYYGFPWHGVEGLMAASVLALAAAAFQRSPSWSSRLGIAWCAGVLVLSKPNAAVFALPLLATFLWFGSERRSALIAMASGILILGTLAMLCGFSPFDVLASYLSVAGRATSLEAVDSLALFDFSLLRLDGTWAALVGASLWLVLAWKPRKPSPRTLRKSIAMLLATGLTAVYSALTNIENPLPAYALAVCGLLACSAAFELRPTGPRTLAVSLALLAMAGASLARGATRERVAAMGPYFWHDPERVPLLEAKRGFFAGSKLSPALVQVLIEEQIARCLVGGPLFYGPRLQWLYAFSGQPSPLHLPLWWHPGSSHAFRESAQLVDVELATKFSARLHIFADFTYYAQADINRIVASHHRHRLGATELLIPRDAFDPAQLKRQPKCATRASQVIQTLFE